MNQGMRLLLAFVISIGVLYVWYTYIAPPPVPQTVTVQPKEPTPDETVVARPKDVSSVVPTGDKTDPKETLARPTDIVIETPVSRIILNTRGGVLTSYELKDYRVTAEKDAPQANLLTETNGSTALFLGLKGYPGFTKDKVYELVEDKKMNWQKRRVVLAWQNKDLKIEKTFLFNHLKTPYAVEVTYRVTNLSGRELRLSPSIQTSLRQKPEPKNKGGILSFLKFQRPDLYHRLYYKEGSLTEKTGWKDFKGGEIARGAISWVALADRYFIHALVPQADAVASATVAFAREDSFLVGELIGKAAILAPGQALTGRVAAYLGPKLHKEMEAVAASLEKSVDYGWFSFLAVPILWLMTFLHGFIPNWGLVIIALTFIVKMLLYPINKKSMESMKGMQQLQPKLKEIKDKYPDDRQKQNQQIMQLFRAHKVNPMSGCLPMLLQFPVYIVLYKVLWNAIELYHAPFFGPYNDLSAPDPYYVMPILLGVFMFLQQKLTPSPSADPTQKKMMMIMPVMFTVFMLFLPLGLVLYIFVNTVVSVVQQYMIRKEITFLDIVRGKWRAA